MKSAEGWASNRGMVLMKSKDLVNWQHSTVHFPEKYVGTNFANVTRVWAPETIWDPEAGKYMIYFSLLTNDGTIPYDKVFYCYANEDFTDLEGEPTLLFDLGYSVIDMDIVYNDADGLYHGFFKNEDKGGILKVTSKTLTASHADDAKDNTVIDPDYDNKTVANLYKGQNLYSDYTLQNHNYFHTSYQNVVMQELGEAALALKLFQNGIHGKEKWKTNALMHNNLKVQQEVLNWLALADGELAMPNGNDWSLFLFDQITSYSTNA